jgi:glycosyltransferase involved in cell wall biosynthesis
VKPRISIITPTIDSPRFIEDAILSVSLGEIDGLEHILVHDGDDAMFARLRQSYPWLRIIPGSGRGATAACAKAIAVASGDFVFQLNSDDILLPGSIDAFWRAAAAEPKIDVWTGGTRIFVHDQDKNKRTLRTLDDPEVTALTLKNVLDDLPLMTARFVRRDLYERLGPLDERFSTCSDREFALRMVLANVREAPLGVRVSELRVHDESETLSHSRRKVPAYLEQHLEIAVAGMKNQHISTASRDALRDWHARETLRKAFYELGAIKTGAFAQTLITAFSRDGSWPWRAFSSAAAFKLRRRGAVR